VSHKHLRGGSIPLTRTMSVDREFIALTRKRREELRGILRVSGRVIGTVLNP